MGSQHAANPSQIREKGSAAGVWPIAAVTA